MDKKLASKCSVSNSVFDFGWILCAIISHKTLSLATEKPLIIYMEKLSQEEIEQSTAAFISLISKCSKAKEKLTPGTAQWTLITRRIRAFEIALFLLEDLQNNKITKSNLPHLRASK